MFPIMQLISRTPTIKECLTRTMGQRSWISRPTKSKDPGKPQESCSRSYHAVSSSLQPLPKASTSRCRNKRALNMSATAAMSTGMTCLSLFRTHRLRKCLFLRAIATTILNRASRAKRKEACTTATNSCRMRYPTPRPTTRGQITVASRDSIRATITQTSKRTSILISLFRW